MNAISAFKHILKYIDKYLEENQHKEERHIDEFCNTLEDFTNEYSDKYSELDYVWYQDYDFNVQRVDNLMLMFKDEQLPIEYDDYESIDSYMHNIKDCDEWCYEDLMWRQISKWDEKAESFIQNAKEVIEDVYERNFNKDVEMDL